ncbi:MAG: L-glutamate gamma-semialdehyde dehydrogenase, partial [Rhizobiaceae bacterium]
GERIACRIYAPVGGYRDLLAYLVRRLLENGANSSFVSVVGDKNIPVGSLLVRPDAILNDGKGYANPNIPMPIALYPDRANSVGVDFGDRKELEALAKGLAKTNVDIDAKPLIPGAKSGTLREAVVSPVDGKTVGHVSNATPELVASAVVEARKGFHVWSRTAVEERAAILEKAADVLEAKRDHFLALLAREAGKNLEDGVSEIREAVDFCRYYARQSVLSFGDDIALPGPTGEDNRLRHRGRGAFVCISPWNFPLAIFAGQVVAALAAGNAVLAKPAEQTPLVAYEMIRILHDAGVPKSALLFVPGDGKVGAALTSHPKIDGVCFTGSTETAWAINRMLAAKNGPIVPLIAETGGLNAMIVDATALPEQVTDDVVSSAFRSAGQRCSALRLLFVQDDVADRMLNMIEGAARELTMGDPMLLNTDIGPVIDADQLKMLNSHVADMRKTQKVRYAATAPTTGTFFGPHIVELKKSEDLTREIFGPILHVVRYKAGQLDKVLDQIEA